MPRWIHKTIFKYKDEDKKLYLDLFLHIYKTGLFNMDDLMFILRFSLLPAPPGRLVYYWLREPAFAHYREEIDKINREIKFDKNKVKKGTPEYKQYQKQLHEQKELQRLASKELELHRMRFLHGKS